MQTVQICVFLGKLYSTSSTRQSLDSSATTSYCRSHSQHKGSDDSSRLSHQQPMNCKQIVTLLVTTCDRWSQAAKVTTSGESNQRGEQLVAENCHGSVAWPILRVCNATIFNIDWDSCAVGFREDTTFAKDLDGCIKRYRFAKLLLLSAVKMYTLFLLLRVFHICGQPSYGEQNTTNHIFNRTTFKTCAIINRS